jgi:hypothetical protein
MFGLLNLQISPAISSFCNQPSSKIIRHKENQSNNVLAHDLRDEDFFSMALPMIACLLLS